MNEIQSIKSKCYAILLISIILTGILILSPAISSLMDTVTRIRSSGIVTNEVYAKSGSVEDIQAAIDKAIAVGATNVAIPEGNFTFDPRDSGLTDSYGRPVGVRFTVPTGGLSIFGAGRNKTVLQMPVNDSAPEVSMFQATGGTETAREVGGWNSGGALRISGITFKGQSNIDTGTQSDDGIFIESCRDFRIDHCSFYYIGSCAIKIVDHFTMSGIYGGDPDRVSQGVVDHCDFFDLYKLPIGTNGYGVGIGRALHYLWTLWDDNIWNVLGVYDKNVFIEDCYFRGVRHAVSATNGGVYVLRNSILEDYRIAEAAITGHPNRQDYYGMRAFEVYNNTIRYTGTYGVRMYGVHMEGGGGVVFNNTIDNLIHAFRFGTCEVAGTRGDTHPRGHLGDMYVWSNTATNCGAVYHSFSNEPGGCPAPQENVEYFLHAPPSERNYVPYPYPHPLTIG